MRRVGLTSSVTALGLFTLAALLNPVVRADGDANAGKEVFTKRCSGCHSLDIDKEGPRLRGVFGRKAGAVQTFQYSDELRRSGIIWNETTLSKWLEDTQKMAPGNDMEFRVGNPEERVAIVEYLSSPAAR